LKEGTPSSGRRFNCFLGGLADIALSDILAYADLARIYDRDIRLQLARVIVALDDAFLGYLKAKQPKKPEGRD
jgi:hypothetical protein